MTSVSSLQITHADPILCDETRVQVSHYCTMSADRERTVRLPPSAVSQLTEVQAAVAVTSIRTQWRRMVDAGSAMSDEVLSNDRRGSQII